MTFGNNDDMVPIAIRRNRWIAALVVLIVLAVGLWFLLRPRPTPPTEVELSPRATFLRTSPTGAEDARVLSLRELGLSPGDSVRLVRLGRWAQGTGQAYGHLLAVFSASDSLAPHDRRYRVPAALDAGPRRATGRHPIGGWATDIPQDFSFGGPHQDSVTVRVPDGASHLFLGVDDLLVGDNTVADSILGVRIVPLGRDGG